MEFLWPFLLFLGGIFTGLYAANVGGGAFISLPLLLLSGLPTQIAVATNRFAAVILELSASLKFYKERHLNVKLGVLLGIVAAVGSFFGAMIVLSIPEKYLNLMVAFCFLLSFLIVFKKDKLGVKEHEIAKHPTFKTFLFTFLLGIYGGFLGSGFGTFIILMLVILGWSFTKSAALARIIGLLMSFSATLVFIQSGAVHYLYGMSLGLGYALGGWFGVHIALKKGEQYVRKMLLVVIAFSFLKLIVDFYQSF